MVLYQRASGVLASWEQVALTFLWQPQTIKKLSEREKAAIKQSFEHLSALVAQPGKPNASLHTSSAQHNVSVDGDTQRIRSGREGTAWDGPKCNWEKQLEVKYSSTFQLVKAKDHLWDLRTSQKFTNCSMMNHPTRYHWNYTKWSQNYIGYLCIIVNVLMSCHAVNVFMIDHCYHFRVLGQTQSSWFFRKSLPVSAQQPLVYCHKGFLKLPSINTDTDANRHAITCNRATVQRSTMIHHI